MKILYFVLVIGLITTSSLFAQAPTVKWQKCLGGIRDDYGHSMIKTSDGGYILAGTTFSYDDDVNGNHPDGHSDFWVVKLTSLGSIEWQKCLGGYESDGAYSIIQTSDGGFAVAGYTTSDSGDVIGKHGSADMWVVKITNSGKSVLVDQILIMHILLFKHWMGATLSLEKHTQMTVMYYGKIKAAFIHLMLGLSS